MCFLLLNVLLRSVKVEIEEIEEQIKIYRTNRTEKYQEKKKKEILTNLINSMIIVL